MSLLTHLKSEGPILGFNEDVDKGPIKTVIKTVFRPIAVSPQKSSDPIKEQEALNPFSNKPDASIKMANLMPKTLPQTFIQPPIPASALPPHATQPHVGGNAAPPPPGENAEQPVVHDDAPPPPSPPPPPPPPEANAVQPVVHDAPPPPPSPGANAEQPVVHDAPPPPPPPPPPPGANAVQPVVHDAPPPPPPPPPPPGANVVQPVVHDAPPPPPPPPPGSPPPPGTPPSSGGNAAAINAIKSLSSTLNANNLIQNPTALNDHLSQVRVGDHNHDAYKELHLMSLLSFLEGYLKQRGLSADPIAANALTDFRKNIKTTIKMGYSAQDIEKRISLIHTLVSLEGQLIKNHLVDAGVKLNYTLTQNDDRIPPLFAILDNVKEKVKKSDSPTYTSDPKSPYTLLQYVFNLTPPAKKESVGQLTGTSSQARRPIDLFPDKKELVLEGQEGLKGYPPPKKGDLFNVNSGDVPYVKLLDSAIRKKLPKVGDNKDYIETFQKIYKESCVHLVRAKYISYILMEILSAFDEGRQKIEQNITVLNSNRKRLLNGYFVLQKKKLPLSDSAEMPLDYPLPPTWQDNSRKQYKAFTDQQSTLQEQLDSLLKKTQQQLQKLKTDAIKFPYFSETPFSETSDHDFSHNFNTLGLKALGGLKISHDYPYKIVNAYLKDESPSGGAYLIGRLKNLNP